MPRPITNLAALPSTPASEVIGRSARILWTFSHGRSWMSLQQIADATQLSKPTTFRLLAALSVEKLIVQDEVSGEYGLGPKVAFLAARLLADVSAGEANIAAMRTVREVINETVVLSVARGTRWYNIVALDAGHSVSLIQNLGVGTALHFGAPGISFLAAMSDTDSADYIANEVAAPLQRAALDCLSLARRLGYVLREGDFLPEVVTIAKCIGHGQRPEVLHVSFPCARDSASLRAKAIRALFRASL
ncbi:MAG: hypothetical protein JWM36_860 [Hyphomicrobiales bacterium]|nr:hypothetical protein [Hyphomicrobiales bacterium]